MSIFIFLCCLFISFARILVWRVCASFRFLALSENFLLYVPLAPSLQKQQNNLRQRIRTFFLRKLYKHYNKQQQLDEVWKTDSTLSCSCWGQTAAGREDDKFHWTFLHQYATQCRCWCFYFFFTWLLCFLIGWWVEFNLKSSAIAPHKFRIPVMTWRETAQCKPWDGRSHCEVILFLFVILSNKNGNGTSNGVNLGFLSVLTASHYSSFCNQLWHSLLAEWRTAFLYSASFWLLPRQPIF